MKRILAVAVLALILTFPSPARADIAPPGQPPGSNPEPGGEVTQVRMLAETVLIDVQAGAPEDSLGIAYVTADFTMRNLGEEAESMAVRFPVGASDGWSGINEIRDLQVQVGGKSVPTRRITGEDPHGGNEPVPWAEFDVTFPPGEEVQVRVKYTLEASGEYPFIWFRYILSSGAGWKDTIGSADIIVRLPYPASGKNVLLDTNETHYGTTPGGSIEGDRIHWHFEELEPDAVDNFEVNLVMPSAWNRLLAEQANVLNQPADGEAWGRLGKLYKEMAFSSRGKGFRGFSSGDQDTAELYALSVEAYENAVTLKPDDALWHAGYADLLSYHAYFAGMNGENVAGEVDRALEEIRIAIDLAPDDPKVGEIADQISSMFPDGMTRNGETYEFPWLTATPAPPTQAAIDLTTSTPRPADAPEAAATDETGAPPTASSPAPVCGSAMLLPLLAVCFISVVGVIRSKPL